MLTLLEFRFDPSTPAKLAYAAFSGSRAEIVNLSEHAIAGGLMQLGECEAQMLPGSCAVLNNRIGKGLWQTRILHTSATSRLRPPVQRFFVVSSDNAAWFDRLDRLCIVPFVREWATQMWRDGCGAGLIREMPGYGTPGYEISTDAEAWLNIVRAVQVAHQIASPLAA